MAAKRRFPQAAERGLRWRFRLRIVLIERNEKTEVCRGFSKTDRFPRTLSMANPDLLSFTWYSLHYENSTWLGRFSIQFRSGA